MHKSLNLNQIISAYVPPFLWAGLIFFLSNQSKLPGAPLLAVDLVLKQSAHTFVYAVLHFLIWRALKKATVSPQNKFLLTFIPIILSFTYSLSDEFHQSFIPGRTATWVDIAFDAMGIAISHYLTHRQKELHSGTK